MKPFFFAVAILIFYLHCCHANVVWKDLVSSRRHPNIFQRFEQGHSNSHNEESSDQPKDAGTSKCGYESCNPGKPGMINVHLVPHTHDDVGWLNTVDEYYYQEVQYILDTVNNELNNDIAKKFIYVEQAYFTRWWNELHDSQKHAVKNLVNNGRLEFILGGWCMNDEAATHYSSIIDQHTLGFRFLQHNFGECGRPKIGWQIDPFGHSREQASLFAQFGFDGLFFARLDYQDYDQRKKTKTLEHVWFGSDSLGDQSTLFTGALNDMSYGEPGGFCFECGDPAVQDDKRLEDYNVDQRVQDFLNKANDQAKYFTTNHIMWPMGSDFQYQNARVNFKNMDKIITYVNQRQLNGSMVNAFYSTPSCYVYAMNKANQTYVSKPDDFFPYAHRDHSFWTGYFTSRPALKGYERSSNNFLQVCKQMEVLADLEVEHGSNIKVNVLRHALGVLQHHDGVSGTEKQHVAFDYAKMVSEGVAACQEVVNASYGKLLPLSSSTPSPTIQFCPLANVSNCPATETSNQFVVIIYNPLGHDSLTIVRVPVSGSAYLVTDAQSNPVSSQLVPVTVETRSLPENRGSVASKELVFEALLPPLGYTTYFVKASSEIVDKANQESWVSQPASSDFTVKNEFLSLTFSGSNGLLKSMSNLEKSITVDLTQSLQYYFSYVGNNDGGKNQASGAYIFRPNGSNSYTINDNVMTHVVSGNKVDEVHQVFGDWATQVYRLYKGARHVEIEWTVGPIPVGGGVGKEVISRFESSLESSSTFYTDANGRQMLKRVRDYRPTWNLTQTEPVAGNYFPVNSRIYIQDVAKDIQLTVLTDRSQGGASISDGQIELMVHRRVLHDDALGVSEPLNEPGLDGKGLVVRGSHYIYLDNIKSSPRHHREMAQRLYMAPSVGYIPTNLTPDQFSKQYRTTWSGLKHSLPDNVHLLTLESWQSTVLIRLEHFYEKNEDAEMSQVAKVSLKDLFAPFVISSLEEQTLGGNQPLSQATRLQWNVQNYGRTKSDMSSFVTPVDPTSMVVVLEPMQIRTFVVKLAEA